MHDWTAFSVLLSVPVIKRIPPGQFSFFASHSPLLVIFPFFWGTFFFHLELHARYLNAAYVANEQNRPRNLVMFFASTPYPMLIVRSFPVP